MVLWICVGVVVIALVVLGVLLVELRSKKARFETALAQAKQHTGPAIGVVRTLVDMPKPSLKLAKPERTLVGHVAGEGDLA